MAMQFSSVVKGRIAESLLITLLERMSYRVTRLGVEVLFDEVKHLDAGQYRALNLPPQLRTLPDLLVADAEIEHAYLVEVKLRRRFDQETARELCATLNEQHKYWPQAVAVVMLTEPMVEDGRFHQDYIRAFPLEARKNLVNPFFDSQPHEGLRMQGIWDALPQLQQTFRYFYQSDDNLKRGGKGQRLADYITTMLRELRALG
jgi:hypothetical protein